LALNDAITDSKIKACSFARLFRREELGQGLDIEVEEYPTMTNTTRIALSKTFPFKLWRIMAMFMVC